uniref:Transmembrane protein n=1 Tax=Mesocestoides corti TaxID=53468 RepID=A0A5K3FKI2_MESCO
MERQGNEEQQQPDVGDFGGAGLRKKTPRSSQISEGKQQRDVGDSAEAGDIEAGLRATAPQGSRTDEGEPRKSEGDLANADDTEADIQEKPPLNSRIDEEEHPQDDGDFARAGEFDKFDFKQYARKDRVTKIIMTSDIGYFTSLPGVCEMLIFLFDLIGMILAVAPYQGGPYFAFIVFASLFGWVSAGVIFFTKLCYASHHMNINYRIYVRLYFLEMQPLMPLRSDPSAIEFLRKWL